VTKPILQHALTVKVTTPTDREIRLERSFNAPRARVWQALTDPKLVAQWWGRGNRLTIERLEVRPGGHWRFVEHANGRDDGFEGRFREVRAPECLVQTFDWDGSPGQVAVTTLVLEDLGDGQTKLITTSLFHTTTERDGMMSAGMAEGVEQSYAALDRVLASGSR
jgi:uncharacterized protein YndB with AHSA1/START domain